MVQRVSTVAFEGIEAHIFIAFLAYCMQITLTRRLHALAPGLTARSACVFRGIVSTDFTAS